MGCCPTRHGRQAVAQEDGSLQGNVSFLIRNLAGNELSLTLPAACPMHELQEHLHREWQIPILAQRLVLKDEVLAHEGAVGRVVRLPAGGDVELVCLRNQLSAEVQETLDLRLLRAVAAGDYSQMASALTDGAGSGQDSRMPSVWAVALALQDREAEEMLRTAGIEADLPDKLGISQTFKSLRRALTARSLPGAVWCLANGADVNIWLRRGEGVQDTSGGTPLHAMCAQHMQLGASAVVQLLCRLRADVNAGDSEGDSPLAHARYFGAKEIEEVLRQYGGKLRGPYYQFSFRR